MSSIKFLKYFLIFLAIIYFLSPIDLIPDIGLVGRVDDLLLIWFLYWRYKKYIQRVKQEFQTYSSTSESDSEGSERAGSSNNQSQANFQFNPYKVLDLGQDATKEEIAKQYKVMLKSTTRIEYTTLVKSFRTWPMKRQWKSRKLMRC